MHLSQPAVSQRLANLQSRIGTDLFERHNGLMRPTAAGARLVAAARKVMHELLTALDDIEDILQLRSTRLRITTQCYTCYRWLPYVMRDLASAYPDLAVDIVPEATEAPFDAVLDDRVDIAIVNSCSNEDDGMREYPLFEDELFAVMSTDHPLAERHYLNPTNFSGQALIVYTGSRHAILEEVLHPAGVAPARLIQVRMTEAIIELARSGQGIAIQSGWAFDDLDHPEGLVAIRITRGGFKRRWRAIVAASCHEEHADAFVGLVRAMGQRMRNQSWRSTINTSNATNCEDLCE
jgi:LysR family transcriptional regulator for metE and metH